MMLRGLYGYVKKKWKTLLVICVVVLVCVRFCTGPRGTVEERSDANELQPLPEWVSGGSERPSAIYALRAHELGISTGTSCGRKGCIICDQRPPRERGGVAETKE